MWLMREELGHVGLIGQFLSRQRPHVGWEMSDVGCRDVLSIHQALSLSLGR
jgi:hypothetical protein